MSFLPKSFLILSIITIVATPSIAQLYSCKVNGSIIYTDRPCDGSASPTSASSQITTQPPAPEKLSQSVAKEEDTRAAVKIEMHYIELIDQQKRLERNLKEERAKLEYELAILKNKKKDANNNLAGAVWEESISKEMEAVTQKHMERIEHAKDLLEKKKAEREATKAELQKYKEVGY